MCPQEDLYQNAHNSTVTNGEKQKELNVHHIRILAGNSWHVQIMTIKGAFKGGLFGMSRV